MSVGVGVDSDGPGAFGVGDACGKWPAQVGGPGGELVAGQCAGVVDGGGGEGAGDPGDGDRGFGVVVDVGTCWGPGVHGIVLSWFFWLGCAGGDAHSL